MDFHGIDLNLLAAFDALMDERNVTRAAARVGVSQPAMSAALSRLRTLFADPLFLRSAQGLLPTPRARDLAGPVSQALRQIEAAIVEKPAFEPGSASQAFSLGLSDYPAFVLLPALVKALAQQAPGVSLRVLAFSGRDSAVDLLDAGTIDAAVGVPPTQPEGRILSRPLLHDDFVTIVRHDHAAVRRGMSPPGRPKGEYRSAQHEGTPMSPPGRPKGEYRSAQHEGTPMSLKTFLALQHVLVSPEGDRHGLVDEALARSGKRRTLGLTLPQMFAAPEVVARTDMAATVMRRVALQSSVRRRLALFAPPVPLPGMVFDLLWHRRNDAHPAQQWFRGRIEQVASTL